MRILGIRGPDPGIHSFQAAAFQEAAIPICFDHDARDKQRERAKDEGGDTVITQLFRLSWRRRVLSAPYHHIPYTEQILRSGCAGCFTMAKPVPLHAGHFCSVGFAAGFSLNIGCGLNRSEKCPLKRASITELQLGDIERETLSSILWYPKKSRPKAAVNSNLLIVNQAAINAGFDLRRHDGRRWIYKKFGER